jgi:phosphoglycolate phosphatase
MQQKAIIFDLDGTLIDSLTDIALCANKVLEELKIEPHPIEKYKEFVGDGAKVLIDNAMGHIGDETLSQTALERFKLIYEQNIHNNTLPYDGIIELLDELSKTEIKMGILSNKPHKFTKMYVDKIFSQFCFLEVHGQKEEIPKKPHPMGATNIAQSFDIPCENIYFVGDTATDIKTAVAANMIPIGVLWGFRDKQELEDAGARYLVEYPDQILDIVNASFPSCK